MNWYDYNIYSTFIYKGRYVVVASIYSGFTEAVEAIKELVTEGAGETLVQVNQQIMTYDDIMYLVDNNMVDITVGA
jgi:hypothetical protein